MTTRTDLHLALSGRRSGERSGNAALYVILMMVMLLGLCSFAVDYGRVQMIKSEMQRTADATARGCLTYYQQYGYSYAVSNCAQLYSQSHNPIDSASGISPTVTLTAGYWNSVTNTFSPVAGTYPAVQVSVTRTAANGNAVPLTWGALVGMKSIDVHATAIAALMGGQTAGLNIEATSNLYFAGMPNTTTNAWGDNFSTDAPYQVPNTIPVVPGTYVTFTNLAGTTSVVPGYVPMSGPGGDTNIVVNHGENWDYSFNNPGPENGIADAKMPEDATVGLFLTNNAPNTTTAPSGQLDWTSPSLANQTTYSSIAVQQPFMIGNGQTSGGTTKQFLVPPGATRLYLGIWDGVQYSNNSGLLTGTISVKPYVQLVQ